MDKTKELNNLFEKWEQQVKEANNDYNDTFIRDGIVDLKTFDEQDKKVLFISNEANIEGSKSSEKVYYKFGENSDIRGEFTDYKTKKIDSYPDPNDKNKEVMSRGRMRERVCCLYQVIINDFSKKDTPYELADEFAFMNLNKTGGAANIDNRIVSFCEEFNEEIKREIDIIHPDLIVWLGCNTLDNKIIRKCIGVDYSKGKYFYKKIPVIRMWHTSYYRSKCDKLGIFDNEIVDKLAYKLSKELESIDWH